MRRTPAKHVGDRLADRLAAVDPLWAAECGLAIDHLPALDPTWWAQRRAAFAEAATELRNVAPSHDRAILRERVEAELLWSDSGEALRELQPALDGTLYRLRFVLDNLPTTTPEERERRDAVVALLPAAVDGFLRTLEAVRGDAAMATRRQVTATVDAIDRWVASDVPAAASFAAVAGCLRTEYLPTAREGDDVGPERFALWSRRYAGAVIGADEYAWAADELAATLDQLRAAHDAMGADTAGHTVTSEAAHVEWAQDEVSAAADACAAAGVLPARSWPTLEVRTFDGDGQQAYYARASSDGTTPAVVWLAAGDGPHFVEYERPVLFHESIPGHHVEATLQSEARHLSRYQRLLYLPGHSEGWGLYAEKLAEDAGLIASPQAKAARLGSRALRLASLLVDVGIHTCLPVPPEFAREFGAEWSPLPRTHCSQPSVSNPTSPSGGLRT